MPEGKRVLIVEDSEDVRKMVAAMLSQSGFEVIEAADGAEALQLLDREDIFVDLVITDMIMPHMGGLEFAKHLARIRPRVPVIFMSGYTEDPVVREMERGNKAFLAKPFTAAALAAKVEGALGSPQAGSGGYR